ncbi:MAG: hypothetical protein R3D57_00315 [Hyphomicrobiaceae bacterium]
MPEICLDVPFKGQRTYVHSTNTWDAVCAHLLAEGWRPEARLILTFRSLMDRRPVLHFPADLRSAGGTAVGDVVVVDEGRRETGYLGLSPQPIEARVPDYEDSIRTGVALGSEGARLTGQPTNMTAIEVVVAVTKFLHQDNVSRDVKWLATRLDLPIGFALSRASALEIRVARQTNALATVSDVVIDGTPQGRISFNPMALAKS